MAGGSAVPRFVRAVGLVGACVLGMMGGTAAAQSPAADRDAVRAGRFDGGKMWTFEYPPTEYFSETYGFEADEAWFEHARTAAVRVPGCSASFVSPYGLLATNHHCVRSEVLEVTAPGEDLLADGFYATTLSTERRVPGYYADQLLAVEDVTDEVEAQLDGVSGSVQRDRARVEAVDRITRRLEARHAPDVATGDSLWVEVVALYDGGRHSAYVFRRFTDVRLVMAVEQSMGFFGGDPDNFTYPRYALDFAFLRVYGADGRPYRPDHHFGWGADGVQEGDAIFVIGSPGATDRLRTMAQLAFLRDVQLPVQRAWYVSRHGAVGEFRDAEPDQGAAWGARNRMFSLSNSLKSAEGRLAALHDPVIMARRADAERELRERVAETAELAQRYGAVFDSLALVQERKAEWHDRYGAFYELGREVYGSQLMARVVAGVMVLAARDAGVSPDVVAELEAQLVAIEDLPRGVEHRYLGARLADFVRYLGPQHELTAAALRDGTPMASAAALLEHSALGSAATTARAVAAGSLSWDDPGMALGRVLMPVYAAYDATYRRLLADERELSGVLGRVRFDAFGGMVPPDGSRSPRIADGVVGGYAYNGTVAPPYTTFYGLYDRHVAHGGRVDWQLPARWRTAPAGLDLATPLNFVSTADTYSGNSGSPAVTPALALVGLNFDRNVEALSRAYIYLPQRGRNVMVDVRGIHAALDHAYDAHRLVEELVHRRLFASEAEADAARGGS